MSKQLKPLFLNLLWLVGLAGLAVVVILLLSNSRVTRTAQAPEPTPVPLSTATPTPAVFSSPFDSPVETPTPEATVTLPPPSTETPWAEPPTPTIPPFPTRTPTPVVTPLPLAEPPFIPLLPGQEPEPYTLLLQEGNILRAINSDGTNERVLIDTYQVLSLFLTTGQIVALPFERSHPAPKGNQVALVLSTVEARDSLGQGDPVEFSIHLFEVNTGTVRLLVQDALEPMWSPDGSRLAYRTISSPGLWVMDVATGATKRIVSAVAGEPPDGLINQFTWSPDGKQLAFLKTFGFARVGAMWLVDAAGEETPRQLVPFEMQASNPKWSPGGNQILFLSHVGEYATESRFFNIWSVNVATGEQRQLTRNIVASVISPWSPEGTWIIFTGANLLEGEKAPWDLWLLSQDGSNLKRITNDPVSELYPTWVSNRQIVFQKSGFGIWEVDVGDGTFREVYPRDTDYMILK